MAIRYGGNLEFSVLLPTVGSSTLYNGLVLSEGDGDVLVEKGRGFSREGGLDERTVVTDGGGLVSNGFDEVVLVSSVCVKKEKVKTEHNVSHEEVLPRVTRCARTNPYLYRLAARYRRLRRPSISAVWSRSACICARSMCTRQWCRFRSSYSVRIRRRSRFPVGLGILRLCETRSRLVL